MEFSSAGVRIFRIFFLINEIDNTFTQIVISIKISFIEITF